MVGRLRALCTFEVPCNLVGGGGPHRIAMPRQVPQGAPQLAQADGLAEDHRAVPQGCNASNGTRNTLASFFSVAAVPARLPPSIWLM